MFYLSEDQLQAAATSLGEAGFGFVGHEDPYWDNAGALVCRDPMDTWSFSARIPIDLIWNGRLCPRAPVERYKKFSPEPGRLFDCTTARSGYARRVDSISDRGALTGAMISGVFGLAWTEWGASGISGAFSSAVRVVGIVVGLVIVFWSARLRRSARENVPGSMFSSPSYRRIVVPEVVALFGGAALLGATGHHEYVIAWFATVVGIHFLAFGRLFFTGFYWLGTAFIAAGIAGTLAGLAGGGLGGIEATTGLIAAASLFVAGGSTVVKAQASSRI